MTAAMANALITRSVFIPAVLPARRAASVRRPTCPKASGRTSLLAQVLHPLHLEIFALLHLMQLARIELDHRKPVLDAFFESRLGRCGLRAEVRLDRCVIAHCVPLH